MNISRTLFTLGLLAALPGTAFALYPTVTQTVGTGSSESYFVINFNDGPNFANNAASDYTFGYKYDGTKTGQDLLDALHASLPPAFNFTESNFGGDLFVNSFSYNGHAQTGNYSLNQSYWSYWESTDARLNQDINDWDFASTGTLGRTLTNNSVDGWTFAANGNSPAPVPEASTVFSFGALLLLSAGGFAIRRRKAR